MPLPSDTASLLEETSLLARIGAGDRSAFRELYARYSVPLFSVALRVIGDRGEAEEALQDAFLKIWRHAAAYDARQSRPFTWAVTILRRTCIDHLRKKGRAPVTTSLPTNDAPSVEFSSREVARPTAEAHEDAQLVRRALAALAAPQRDALELALFSGLSHTEIADRLEQPVGSVKSWIRRGLLDLRTTLTASAP